MKVRVTPCHFVEVVNEEGIVVSHKYVFGDNEKQAREYGELMLKAYEERKAAIAAVTCKCGYDDCIFHNYDEKVCSVCFDGDQFDDEEG